MTPYKNKKRICITLLVIILPILLIWAWVRIQTKPIQVAKSTWPTWDYFEYVNTPAPWAAAQTLSFKTYPSYKQALDSFISNDSKIALLTIYEALIAYEKLKGDVVILLLLDYSIGSDGLVSQPEFSHPTHLKEKKIGVQKGSIAHFTLLKFIEKAGLSKTDVQIVFGSPENLVEQFRLKSLDALSLYDPYLYQLKKESTAYNLLFSSKEMPRKICNIVMARKSWAKNNKKIVTKIKEKWFRSTQIDNALFALNLLPNYNDYKYIRHIQSQIFLTGSMENYLAFGEKDKPGYLWTSIKEMTPFLKDNDILSKTFIGSPSILFFDE